MVDKNNSEREYALNEAINYGLISKNVVEMVDKFSIKNNLSKSNFVDGIIDPGIKSIDSIISKMYRKSNIEMDNNISLTDIKDVIRCSVIVDNYNQVIPLVKELRKSIPSLNGDVCENETGYIGIHLSLLLNGFNAEIQISTRDGWYAKQAGEEIYERWRNFSLAKEVSELLSMPDNDKRKEKSNQLFSRYTLKEIQFSYCKNMFSSLNKFTKLDKLKEPINAVLYLNNYNYNIPTNNLLKKYNIKINDITDKKQFFNNCKDYFSLAEETKKDLLEYANKALEIVRNNKEVDCINLLTHKERNFIALKKKYFSLISNKMKQKYNGQFEISKYISKLNKITNKLAFNNIDYLNSNSLDDLVLDFNNEEICKLEEIVRRDIFSKNYFLSLIGTKKDKDNN